MMHSLVEQARQLSSGTIASLINNPRYEVIDEVRIWFIEFCEENTVKFEKWQDAWESFSNVTYTEYKGINRNPEFYD